MSTVKTFGPGRSVAENQEASFANRVENWMRAHVAKNGLPQGWPTLYHLYTDAHYPNGGPSEEDDAFYIINDVAALVQAWALTRERGGDRGPTSMVDNSSIQGGPR